MTEADIRECETCGRVREIIAYALPGIPMTVGNCRECWQNNAYPFDIAEGNTEMIGGIEKSAAWWKESMTYRDGKYVTMEEAFP